MKQLFKPVSVLVLFLVLGGALLALTPNLNLSPSLSLSARADRQAAPAGPAAAAVIVDHNHTDADQIPSAWIEAVENELNIFYGHTSHGSQLTTGADMLNLGSLDLQHYGDDLGHNGDTSWVTPTRDYLDAHPETNVVMWSWCAGVSDNTEAGINTYLDAMSQLEADYPDVTFVYMTGHLDGTGESGNLHLRNEQIRDYCRTNNKVLFDFADIESYDPDGAYYLDLAADDRCYYDSDGNGSRESNWADEWCAANPGECLSCASCAHSRCLNCQLKGGALWWLLARLAGWGQTATLDAQKSASADTVTPGQTVHYTLVVRWLGTPPTTTVTLTDTIPAGLAYVPGSLTATHGDESDADAPTLTWSGVLSPTPVVTVTYATSVTFGMDDAGSYPHPISNEATVVAPGYESLTPMATVTVIASTEADLSPSEKRVSPLQASYGQRVTYTVGIANATGPLSQRVYLTDTLPQDLAYVPGSLTATHGDYSDADAPTLTWSGLLSPTPAVTVTYAATVTYHTPGNDSLVWPVINRATIAATGDAPLTRTATLTVTRSGAVIDLSPSKKHVSPSRAEHGERVTYTIGIVNATGPLSHTVYLTDTLPQGLMYVPGSLSATSGDYSDAAAPTLTWSGPLSPTPAVTLTYAAVITYFGEGTVILPRAAINNVQIVPPAGAPLWRTATLQANWAYWKHMYLPLAIKGHQASGR